MSESAKQNDLSRREFLTAAGVVSAGIAILPGTVMAGIGQKAPSDKLNIAVVGIGGMGNANLKAVKATENIVALCDVDWKYAAKVFEENPQAKKYKDWRKMFDEMGKEIDAVIVATADHYACHYCCNSNYNGKTCLCSKTINSFGLRITFINQSGSKI